MKMSKKGMGKFALGAAIGAGIGLLFAPKKGSETREDLKNKTKKIAEDIKNIDKDELKAKFDQKVKELKKDLENLNKETAIEMVKEKGQALVNKADDLIDMAKEKSAPVIEKAAKEVKEKTVSILQSAIDKIESTDAKPAGKKKANTTKKKAA